MLVYQLITSQMIYNFNFFYQLNSPGRRVAPLAVDRKRIDKFEERNSEQQQGEISVVGRRGHHRRRRAVI